MLRPTLRYVALGDSYTIGTAVAATDRWPDRLVARLGGDEGSEGALRLVANLAVNGWTSGDVIRGQLPRLGPLLPGFATLLIGVNDVVQRVALQTYRTNVDLILDALLARLAPDRVLTVTTPDYTVTPIGPDYGDPVVQAAAIRQVNAVMAASSAARGIACIDIHDLSLIAADDRSLVADDGLHPSGRQYALWVERMVPVVTPLLVP